MAKNMFNSIMVKSPQSSVFDMSNNYRTTCNIGELIPVYCAPCLPGDRIKLSNRSLLRFAPLISPAMQRFDVYFHWFFVPNRIQWANWEDWISPPDPEGTIPLHPVIKVNSVNTSRLLDYLCIPDAPAPGSDFVLNALPFGAYQRIYNEYYRDENLIAPVPGIDLADGENVDPELRILRLRAWQKDYFAGALPWAQKGDLVTIPLGTFNDVAVNINFAPGTTSEFAPTNPPPTEMQIPTSLSPDFPLAGPVAFAKTSDLVPGAATIEDLRRAYRLQEFLERDATGGTRYNETIYAHFRVRSSDKRLQRPEYITGSQSPVQISEVLNTTGDTGAADPLPQGNMAGHAYADTRGGAGRYFCEEHGYLMCIMSVLPKAAYMQGIPRHFSVTNDRYQYPWPEFDHLGEEEVFNREIYADGSAADALVFGYVPRNAYMKYMPSYTTGQFRTSLDFWTLTRKFATRPGLNQDFIEVKPEDQKRIFAVTDVDTDCLYVECVNIVTTRRLLSKYATPIT